MLDLSAQSSEPVKLELEADFEDKETVHRFLVLITEQTFDAPSFPDEYFSGWRIPLYRLLQFLDKWGSERGVGTLRSIGATAIMRDELRWTNAFMFCAMLNDLTMCRNLILRYAKNWADHPGQSNADDDPHRLIYGFEEGSMFELGCGPFEFMCALPPAYAYALTRAGVDHNVNDDDETEAFADKFVEVAIAAMQVQRQRASRSWEWHG